MDTIQTTHSEASLQPHPPQGVRVVIASIFGTALEYYDFTLFVFLATTISPLFFPSKDPLISLLSALATYAIGFVMRPLGSIFFGTMGDRYGRKKALSLSIVLMAFPTFAIGLLPDFSQIGLAAPILLIICRMCQGFCAGGEYNGAGIFTVENVRPGRAGFAGALVAASSALGSGLGSVVSMVVSMQNMPSWAWRLAFILGGVLALTGYFIRTRLWEHFIPGKREFQRLPIVEVFRTNRGAVFSTIGIASFSVMMFQIPMAYPHIFLSTMRGWTLSEALTIATLGRIWYMFCSPLAGLLADRIGGYRMLLGASVAIFILIWPIFYLFCTAETYWGVVAADFAMITLTTIFQGPMNLYMAQLFPRTSRYSGVAFGYTFGQAIFGGSTVAIATWLATTYSPVSPAYYMMGGAVLGMIAVLFSRPKYPLA